MITIDHMKKEEQKKKTEEGRAEIRRERMERRRVHERYVLLDSSFFFWVSWALGFHHIYPSGNFFFHVGFEKLPSGSWVRSLLGPPLGRGQILCQLNSHTSFCRLSHCCDECPSSPLSNLEYQTSFNATRYARICRLLL